MAIRRVEPAADEFLANLEARSKQPNSFFRVMANRPEALRSFVPLHSAIMGPGSVERRLKLLLYLAVSYANQCAFCISANTPTAHRAGVNVDEIHAIQEEQNGGFSAAEQAALEYARHLTRSPATGDAGRDALTAYFTDEQIVEITLVIAMSNFTNRFNNGLSILPEGH